MHQTVGNILSTVLNPLQNMTQARHDIIDFNQATVMHDMQTRVATILVSTLGALAFSRNVFLIVRLIADWQTIV